MPFALSAFVSGSGDTVQQVQGTKTVTLSVPGMFCQGCVYSVRKSLNGMNGVKQAQVSLSSKEAVVVYDPQKTSPEEIVQHKVIQGFGGSIKKRGKT